MQPIVKWAGGKSKLAPHLVPLLRAHLAHTNGRYVEPFLGGGAIFLALDPQAAIVSDVNAHLIEVYQAVQENPGAVARALQAFADRTGTNGQAEAVYYEIRNEIDSDAAMYQDKAARAARFIYLNKTGFNGLYRVNRKGKFNVPWGGPRNIQWATEDDLVAYGARLSRAKILCQDFRQTLLAVQPGDVVYVDPPYWGTFSSYAKGGFDEQAHRDLAAQLCHLAEHGAVICASNADAPEVREMYSWAKVESQQEVRAINSDGAGRDAVGTVLIWGGAS